MIKNKIKKIKELRKIVAAAKKKGKKIAFTNGCFDILHLGHIRYLEKAAKEADILIVAVNSDASVRKIKGKPRPLISEKARASVVAALECVNYVIIFSQSTPLNLIKVLKPDVLAKGSDWREKDIVGKDIVASCGGKVISIDFVKGYSTSSIISKIKSK